MPNPTQVGTPTMLGVNITNNSTNSQLGVDTSLQFPGSLNVNAAPSHDCAAGTTGTTMNADGSITITLSNATVAAQSMCKLSATVTPSATCKCPIIAPDQTITLVVQ